MRGARPSVPRAGGVLGPGGDVGIGMGSVSVVVSCDLGWLHVFYDG